MFTETTSNSDLFENSAVEAGLNAGTFSYDDLGCREGMTDWVPLRDLLTAATEPLESITLAVSAAQTLPHVYTVNFGSGMKVDGFGFVGKGMLRMTDTQVEISAYKHWHPGIRCVVFLLGLVAAIYSFTPALDAVGNQVGGIAGSILALSLGNPVTATVFTFWAVHHFCASLTVVTFKKSQIKSLGRLQRILNYQAPDSAGKTRTAIFSAKTTEAAMAIEKELTKS